MNVAASIFIVNRLLGEITMVATTSTIDKLQPGLHPHRVEEPPRPTESSIPRLRIAPDSLQCRLQHFFCPDQSANVESLPFRQIPRRHHSVWMRSAARSFPKSTQL